MNIKKIIFIIMCFIIYFIFYSFSYSYSISKDLEDNIFRLRIIANSNSEEDQNLKLKIRDNILEYLNNISFSTKEETISYLNSHKSDIETIISNTIKENGFNYQYEYEIKNSFYPQKKYYNITLPSGNYDGLQIKIGSAKGKNWWCILFPQLCLIDSSTCKIEKNSQTILDSSLSSESAEIVKSQSSSYKFKFKIINFINNI